MKVLAMFLASIWGLGNAVVPQVAEVVGKLLLERFKENEKPST